jgi:hypothetical protein
VTFKEENCEKGKDKKGENVSKEEERETEIEITV